MAQDGINIVWNSLEGDKILDRLARLLAERTGWPLSIRPTGHALINYDMNYIDFAQRFSDWRKTPWAAYFSHYEEDNYHKQMWWEMAMPLVNIQTVTAEQYGRMCPNPMKVIPPVEARFEIRERKAHSKPVLGISGFVCPGGRKGEHYLSRLAMELEGRLDFTAHGVGWPVKMEKGGLENLVEFYNRLDVYVCTSTIEGIPMPPLEALRCGIPVIIPWGVGMLNELPEMEGIWRYERGNYEDLYKLAIKLLEEGKLDETQNVASLRERLREAAGGYTEEAWVESHVKGFERMLKAEGKFIDARVNYSGVTTDRHGQRGVYYVAFGKPAIKCAAAAIRSFKEHLPDIPTAVASERPNRSNGAYKQMKEKDFKELQNLFEEMVSQADYYIECKDEDIGGRAAKVRIDELAPKEWTYIAYLDADTEITVGEDFLWRLVEDGWDMAICKNPSRFHVASQMRRSDNKDECEETFRMLGTDQVIQLNGGVFCYQRNERTREFFRRWQEEWRKHGKRDQAALLRSLFMHPLKLYVLGNEWNTITRYDSAETAAWLLHYPMTARRWRGVVHYRLDDPQAWNAVREFERTER